MQVCDLQGVSLHQRSLQIAEGIHFTLSHGEFCYLVGKTGSGKSTLLKTLYAELPLLQGKGLVAGFALEKIKRSEIPYLRRKLGIVFQDFQLLPDRDVDKNLRFVLDATGWKNQALKEGRIKEVLEMVQLNEKGYKKPHQLSGGEQQKVSIARALLNDPALLIADEPTGNLDPDVSDEIVRTLHKISHEGSAVLMATHDYRLIEKFPARVIKIEKGKLYELN